MTHERLAGFLANKGLLLRRLDDDHMIAWFDCGRDEQMNSWLYKHARKWQDEHLCQVWVLSSTETPGDPIGFFTLSAHQVTPESVPTAHRTSARDNRAWVNNLQASFPASLLGKFALDAGFQGQGFGEILMLCAYAQHLEAASHLGAKFLVLDAQHSNLAAYYETRFGFLHTSRVEGHERMIKSTIAVAAELAEAL